jgi:hypothetical protein
MKNRRRFDRRLILAIRSEAGHRVHGNVVVDDQEKSSKITIRLAHALRELAQTIFHADKCERLAIAAIVDAVLAIEEAGVEMISEPFFENWPPFPFSLN